MVRAENNHLFGRQFLEISRYSDDKRSVHSGNMKTNPVLFVKYVRVSALIVRFSPRPMLPKLLEHFHRPFQFGPLRM